jgi:hypothetical protein
MAYKGKWSALKNIQVKNVVITNQDGTTTYTLGTDYTLNLKAGSVMILSDGNIANGSVLKVNYAFADQEEVNALETSSAPERWVRFEGLNTANGSKPVVVDIFKFSTSPLKSLGLINEDLSNMELEGKALADNTRESGSKYFRQRSIA